MEEEAKEVLFYDVKMEGPSLVVKMGCETMVEKMAEQSNKETVPMALMNNTMDVVNQLDNVTKSLFIADVVTKEDGDTAPIKDCKDDWNRRVFPLNAEDCLLSVAYCITDMKGLFTTLPRQHISLRRGRR